jgi:hypothetical protein
MNLNIPGPKLGDFQMVPKHEMVIFSKTTRTILIIYGDDMAK